MSIRNILDAFFSAEVPLFPFFCIKFFPSCVCIIDDAITRGRPDLRISGEGSRRGATTRAAAVRQWLKFVCLSYCPVFLT